MHRPKRTCPGHWRTGGFTLIELMVTIAVVAIIAALAAPSFAEFRERALMRTTLNEFASAIELARFEAVQRDRPVTVRVGRVAESTWCVGASEGTVPCDCFETDPVAAGFCAVVQYPSLVPGGGDGQAQATAIARGVRMLDAPDFNGTPSFTFDPKLGILADPARTGAVAMASPQARDRYRGRLIVSPLGRTRACSDLHQGRDVVGLEWCP